MTAPTVPHCRQADIFRADRPGWIPESVGDDWDRNPYAYQTREELMPAGHFHNLYVQILAEMLRPLLARKGLQLLLDVFIFYRDWEKRKQRIAPDALIARGAEVAPSQAYRSYDLDVEPLPLCVIEITSASSHMRDQHRKRLFYAGHCGAAYLVIDILDREDEQRLPENISLALYRLQGGDPVPVAPDAEGYLTLECIGVQFRTVGRRLIARVAATGEILRTAPELTDALAEAEQRATAAEQSRHEAEQRATAAEQSRREAEQRATAAEEELARLRAELAKLQGKQS